MAEADVPSTASAGLLVAWAEEAGFTRAGLAVLEPSAHGQMLRRWVERGEHAGMEWMGRRLEVREDPRSLLPGARYVLCVALQYHPLDGEEEVEGDLWPRVARYARGRDYHDIMGRQLKSLAQRIREAYPGSLTRPYVDTGPVLERELASKAGLGAFGKNCNLLHRDWGSYFLLGELLLDLDLEEGEDGAAAGLGEPVADLCGGCTLCLEACPTQALREPYRLDSRRCISYWTIEHRGDLPEEAREMVGDWVFGCDICQEVCPWNRRGPIAGRHPKLRLPPQRRELDLAGLLGLDREGYVERFQVSPMKRAKLPGLKRNAAVAMGNRGDQEYVPALVQALEDAEPVVRQHAAWALGKIGGREARAGLRVALRCEKKAAVLGELETALARAASGSAESGGH